MPKRILLLAALLLLALPARADITIGLIAPLTGQYAVFGEQLKRGAEQAVMDINTAGGIKGEKLTLRIADDACDPKQAVAVAGQMASAGVKYVVGHYCSGSAIPSSKVMMDEGMLLISPAATNPKYTDEAKELIFRVCGRDDRQGVVLGNYLLQNYRTKKIAIVHDKSAYGRGVADETKKTLNAGGVTETLNDTYTPGERDYGALIAKLKQQGIEVLFIGGYHTEAGLIARQLHAQGAKIQIIGGDALVTDEFWSIAGPAGEGVLMSFGPDPRNRPEAAAALKALRQGGYEPEGYTLYTYASFQVLAEGLRRAAKAEPATIAIAIRNAPVETVLGKLAFDAKGDIAGPTYVLYRWHDGKYAEVKP
jgi:branched-chain amino acid transport system substrate-binding protein